MAASTKAGAEAIEFEGVRLTHPEKVLYPEHGVTKLALAEYYRAVAPWILPHVADRPLSLVRCPAGQEKSCFYQKHLGRMAPPALAHMAIREKDGTGVYSIVENLSGLIALAQIGVLEIHPWGARRDDIEQPDRLIFDLDPDAGLAWARVAEAAIALRDDLAAMGFQSFLKTTGGKGLHIVVPIARRHDWSEAKAFARAFAAAMVDEAPDRYTINPLKKERVGKIFIDYLRNERGATAIAPYSTRSRPGPPIATPIAWSELAAIRPDAFGLASLPRRLAGLAADPWADIDAIEQVITPKARKAVGL